MGEVEGWDGDEMVGVGVRMMVKTWVRTWVDKSTKILDPGGE